LTEIEASEHWKRLVLEIQKTRGPVMVIGAPDSGKTTLARFLVRELSERGEGVGYIDGDMGQSILGPPTTQAMALFDRSFMDLEKAPLGGVYFVGSVSPRGHRLETVVGLKRLLERSQVDRDRIAILDTTGYVAGDDALELKHQKIDLLGPHHIIAVQQAREIEPILSVQESRERASIHRLPSSSLVQTRSQEDRRRYRWNRFKEYFKSLRMHEVDLKEVALTGTHRFRISEGPQGDLEGLILGLNDADSFLVTLGIFEKLDRPKKILSCLVPSNTGLERVRTVRMGSIGIDLSEETNGERFIKIG
jgi:polynucleotide 5'-hydroxyl-kinase GRC3/NOL9